MKLNQKYRVEPLKTIIKETESNMNCRDEERHERGPPTALTANFINNHKNIILVYQFAKVLATRCP